MTPVIRPDKTYYMPDSWNEINVTQLRAIAPILFTGLDRESASPYIIHGLLGWKKDLQKAMRRTKDVSILLTDIRFKLYPLIEWVFSENTLTKNVIPVIEIAKEHSFLNADRLYGPADNFENLTIGEFDDAEYWFDTSTQSKYKEAHALDMLIAILYRAPKAKYKPEMGDIRQGYNIHLNELRAAQLTKVSVGVKLGILIWYMGCRAALVKQYGFMFDKSDKASSSLKGWTPVIHDLAGGKFGDLEKTNQTSLKTILYELHLLHIKAQEHKKAHPELYK